MCKFMPLGGHVFVIHIEEGALAEEGVSDGSEEEGPGNDRGAEDGGAHQAAGGGVPGGVRRKGPLPLSCYTIYSSWSGHYTLQQAAVAYSRPRPNGLVWQWLDSRPRPNGLVWHWLDSRPRPNGLVWQWLDSRPELTLMDESAFEIWLRALETLVKVRLLLRIQLCIWVSNRSNQ